MFAAHQHFILWDFTPTAPSLRYFTFCGRQCSLKGSETRGCRGPGELHGEVQGIVQEGLESGWVEGVGYGSGCMVMEK